MSKNQTTGDLFPQAPEGHHWERYGDDAWATAEGTTNHHVMVRLRAVPDAPPWPTTPGKHDMWSNDDECIVQAWCDRNGQWRWVSADGREIADFPDTRLRPPSVAEVEAYHQRIVDAIDFGIDAPMVAAVLAVADTAGTRSAGTR